MRSKLAMVMLSGGLLLASIAACSANPGGPAQPATSTTADAPTSTTPKSEITVPLDTSAFTANICSGLTDAQVAPYIGAVGSKTSNPSTKGPGCFFNPQDVTKPTLGYGLINVATPTEELLYESAGSFPWRKKINPILGYPAVDESQGAGPNQGDCQTGIAIDNTQSVSVDFNETNTSGQYYATPCVVSEALALDLVQNIKAGVA